MEMPPPQWVSAVMTGMAWRRRGGWMKDGICCSYCDDMATRE
jgi:hypothetical protein